LTAALSASLESKAASLPPHSKRGVAQDAG